MVIGGWRDTVAVHVTVPRSDSLRSVMLRVDEKVVLEILKREDPVIMLVVTRSSRILQEKLAPLEEEMVQVRRRVVPSITTGEDGEIERGKVAVWGDRMEGGTRREERGCGRG